MAKVLRKFTASLAALALMAMSACDSASDAPANLFTGCTAAKPLAQNLVLYQETTPWIAQLRCLFLHGGESDCSVSTLRGSPFAPRNQGFSVFE